MLSETDTEVAAHLLELEVESRRRPDRGDAAGVPPASGRVHPGRRRRPGPGPGGRRAPQLTAGGRARRGRELPRLRRGGVHRAHPRGARARPGPGRHDHPGRASRSPTSTAARPRARRYHVDWDLSAAEKDGYDWFMRKEIFEQPRAVADTLLGRHDQAGLLQLDEVRMSEDELRDIDKIIIIGCGTAFYAGLVAKYAIEHWTRIPVRGRAGPRVPLPRPDPDPVDAGGGDQPVRRDRRHADGDPARPRAALQGAGDLQHQRLDDPARVRRGDLHPRRPGDRGRLDQGVPHPAGRLLPARRSTSPRCAARKYGDEIATVVDELAAMPAHIERVLDRRRRALRRWPRGCGTPGRCCSWAGTPASRWRWRAR